ncbi:MAG: hypothetical protein KDB80_00270, partial [Planctomycetes bacterium]|nr:hypothetical protein [Planctomycetota bacterium]
LGTSLGVWWIHAASRRLGMGAFDCLTIAALCGTCAGVVFFATALEIHGVFFAAFGWAALRTASLIVAPNLRNAFALGLATGVAFCVHATGQMLVPLLLVVAWSRFRSVGWARVAGIALTTVVAHWGSIVVVVWAVRTFAGSKASIGGSANFLEVYATWALNHPELLPRKLPQEWLVPFFPISVLFVAGFFHRGMRALCAVFSVSLLAYFALAFALVASTNEHGAYLLPLAWPAAWLTVASVPRWSVWSGLVASVACAIWLVTSVDDPSRCRTYAREVRAAAGSAEPYLLLGSPNDFEACALTLPGVEHLILPWLAGFPEDVAVASLGEVIRAMQREGRVVYVTEGAWQLLLQVANRSPTAVRLIDYLDESWKLLRVDGVQFRGWRVDPR